MPTEPNNQGQPPAEGTPPQDPQPITQEQLDQRLAETKREYEEKLQQERELYKDRETQLINSLNNQNTQQQPQPQAPTITKEEALRHMTEEGDPSKLIEYYDSKLENQNKTYEQRLQELRQIGGSQISSLAIQQAERDSERMPYFSKFKKEIMETVSKSGSTDPAIVAEAYDYVAGKHMKEILEEEREKMLRQAVEQGTLTPGGGKNGRGDPVEEGPKPEEVYTDRALSLLEQKGVTPDQFLKKVGSSMPFREYQGGKGRRTQQFKEGFKDLQKIEEENRKLEEEFEWY